MTLAFRVSGWEVFANYVRRGRVTDGIAYYILAVHFDGCRGSKRRGDSVLVARLGGALGGGGVAAIEDGDWVGSGAPGISGVPNSATVTLVVPDDVASVTVHYPAGEANPGIKPALPAVTINTKPIGNFVLYNVHRASGGAAFAPVTMTWHGAGGAVIKTFNRL